MIKLLTSWRGKNKTADFDSETDFEYADNNITVLLLPSPIHTMAYQKIVLCKMLKFHL